MQYVDGIMIVSPCQQMFPYIRTGDDNINYENRPGRYVDLVDNIVQMLVN